MQRAEKFMDVWTLNNAYKKKLNRNKVAVLTVNYYTLNCVPTNLHVEALTPVPQNVTDSKIIIITTI